VNEIDRSWDGQRDLQRAEPAFDGGVRDALRGIRILQRNDEEGTRLVDRPQRPQLGEHVSLLVKRLVIDRLSHVPYRQCNRSQQPISAAGVVDGAHTMDLVEAQARGAAGFAQPGVRRVSLMQALTARAMGDAIRAARRTDVSESS
jgi:hypothetical protein